jgi:hypothetical protein
MSTSDEVVTPPEAAATEAATPETTATDAAAPETTAMSGVARDRSRDMKLRSILFGGGALIIASCISGTQAGAQSYPLCTGTGMVSGVPEPGNPIEFRHWAKDGKCGGLDYFEQLHAYFPALVSPCAGSISPNGLCIDMAYALNGTLSFYRVNVPQAGHYRIRWRYAFAKGFFPQVCDRKEALVVNGVQVIDTIHFMRTAENIFSVFQHVDIVVALNAGNNTLVLYNNGSQAGVSRVDDFSTLPTLQNVTPKNGGPKPLCPFP